MIKPSIISSYIYIFSRYINITIKITYCFVSNNTLCM